MIPRPKTGHNRHDTQLFLFLVLTDQLLYRFDANLDCAGGVLGHGHEHTCLLTLLIPDGMEAGTAADAQSVSNHEQSGGLHLTGLHAQAFPALPLLKQLIVDGGLLGAVLAVERILALHDTGMVS